MKSYILFWLRSGRNLFTAKLLFDVTCDCFQTLEQADCFEFRFEVTALLILTEFTDVDRNNCYISSPITFLINTPLDFFVFHLDVTNNIFIQRTTILCDTFLRYSLNLFRITRTQTWVIKPYSLAHMRKGIKGAFFKNLNCTNLNYGFSLP